MFNRLRALQIFEKCTGREIWSVELCQNLGVPQVWIEELQDCFESGFSTDRETIYELDRRVLQYQGVRDLDIAFKVAEFLGVDVNATISRAFSDEAKIMALREAIEEL